MLESFEIVCTSALKQRKTASIGLSSKFFRRLRLDPRSWHPAREMYTTFPHTPARRLYLNRAFGICYLCAFGTRLNLYPLLACSYAYAIVHWNGDAVNLKVYFSIEDAMIKSQINMPMIFQVLSYVERTSLNFSRWFLRQLCRVGWSQHCCFCMWVHWFLNISLLTVISVQNCMKLYRQFWLCDVYSQTSDLISLVNCSANFNQWSSVSVVGGLRHHDTLPCLWRHAVCRCSFNGHVQYYSVR
jgi:hypothetical protein